MYTHFSGEVKGLNYLWVIGDEFVRNSYEDFFGRKSAPESYARQNFEVRAFFAPVNAATRSVLARIKNAIIYALNEQPQLPMLITIIIDDDVIKNVNYPYRDIYGQRVAQSF